MILITETLRAQLLVNGQQSLDNDDFDPPPVVKLFTPDASATWLLTEIDPDDHDHAFGLCDLGQGFPELGYVSLAELQSARRSACSSTLALTSWRPGWRRCPTCCCNSTATNCRPIASVPTGLICALPA